MRILSLLAALLIASPCMATTVCWSGTEIAADSQQTHGHIKCHTDCKIVRSEKRHACLAAAGDVQITSLIKEYFLHSIKPMEECPLTAHAAENNEDIWCLLLIYDDGRALYYGHHMDDPVPISAPFAMGSGSDFALAALLLGKSAGEAIEVAKALDIYTGGTTHVLKAPRLVVEVDVKLPKLELPGAIVPKK